MKEKSRVNTDITLVILKKVADQVTEFLTHTPITPNQVTIFNFLIFSSLAGFFFFKGGYLNNIIALIFLFIHSFFDLVDGELARRKKMTSPAGEWLEFGLDGLLQTIVIFSISAHYIYTYNGSLRLMALLPIFGQGVANVLGARLSYKYGLDPLTGSKEFQSLISKKLSFVDRFLANMLVPTDFIYILLFSLRFYLLIGIICSILVYTFFMFGIFVTIRSLFIFVIFTLHYSTDKKNRILQTVVFLDRSNR